MSSARAIATSEPRDASPARLLIMFAVALFGLGVSIFLAIEYFQSGGIPCTDVGCDTVRQWHNDHFPKGLLPVLGTLYFVVVAFLTWRLSTVNAQQGKSLATGAMALGVIGALTMAGLIGLEAFSIHAFCFWCMLVAGSTLVYGVLSIAEWAVWQKGATAYRLEFDSFLKWGAVPLVAVVLLAQGMKTHEAPPPAEPPSNVVNGDHQNKPGDPPAPAVDPKYLNRPGVHTKGPANAKITIVEFADPGCPACASQAPVMDDFLKQHPKDVRLVYRHFPLRPHVHSRLSAEAAEAAGAQGKFWEYRGLLFKNLEAQEEANLYKYAKQVGLNMVQFKKDLTTHKYAAKVQQDRDDGDALRVTKTPTMFITGGQKYEGPMTMSDLETIYKSTIQM